MRLALGSIDANGVVLDLPTSDGSETERLRVRVARALKGTLTQGERSLLLSELESEWVELEAVTMTFGSTRVTSIGDATFSKTLTHYEKTPEVTKLELDSRAVHAASLRIEVGSVDVQGELRLQECRLIIDGGTGRIEAKHACVESFRLHLGGLRLSATELLADGMLVGWGPDGFRLEATQLKGPELTLEIGAMRLDAARLAVKKLVVHGGRVSFSEATVANAQLDVAFRQGSPAVEPVTERASGVGKLHSSEPKKTVFDFRLLDGLSGALHVDAVVDMTVPIIGRRRATHKLRLSVDDGSIDYRAIENSLSALEDALLDFSVRDGALVLERGIPLLPTRGFGKRLLIWQLSPEDLALAQQGRVRLAVLPSVQLAADLARAKAEQDGGPSSFALRRLSLENMDLKLSLDEVAGPTTSAIAHLSFERLLAYGNLQHELQGEPRKGVVHAQLDALSTGLTGLALGSMRVDVKSLKLEALRDAALCFVGLTPSHLRVDIAGLYLRGLAFVPDDA